MDLDSVKKKTVSTVSDRYFIYFQDCMMTSVISGEIPFCLYFFPDTWQAINRKLEISGGFLSLYGKYKQVWDFGSNNGSLVRILKSLVNQGCVVKRGTAKIPVADSNSILFITCGIQENGANA